MRSDKWISFVLTLLSLWPSAATAQQPTPPAGEDLKIVVIAGEGGKNDIIAKYAEELVVKVVDGSNSPVAGAEVTFQMPMAGPSGRFSDSLNLHRTKTDAEGMARTRSMIPNDEEGRFNIKVTALHGLKTATTVIAQTNLREGRDSGGQEKSRKRLWIALGVIGAAAIAGGIAASGNGNGTVAAAASKPVVISPGPIVVGGPR